MSEDKIYPVSDAGSSNTYLNKDSFQTMYQHSIDAPEDFWAEQAGNLLHWHEPWKKVTSGEFAKADTKWFEGTLNVAANCIDRHLETRGDQTAIIWEGDNPNDSKHVTYREMHTQVCKMANVYKNLGVSKGDRVVLYMPMIPEAAYAMLACARIGAVHSVVFGGFSPQSLKDRILDSDCQTLITADEGLRGGQSVPLKANAEKALESCPNVHTVVTVRKTGADVPWQEGRDVCYHKATEAADNNAMLKLWTQKIPYLYLYTSGSTGQPKGMVHTTAGYMVYAAYSFTQICFEYEPDDVYWCTADIGWITGHSYIVYGPLLNGATTVMFEGVPSYPDYGRFWSIVEKHKVTQFYTAPTAIRALAKQGLEVVEPYDISSLKIIGTVGEPINEEAWHWYNDHIGKRKCPIVDTWWQTETGGIMISPIPNSFEGKPTFATLPFVGVVPALMDENGIELEGKATGNLVLCKSWPSQIRSVYGDHQRCIDTYFTTYPGYYFTGDSARRDADGYYWVTGRVDDVINVSGHRLGTAEIESALVLHPSVAEAAVVGYPHDIKGQGIYAYVSLMTDTEASEELRAELLKFVAKEIGAFARPEIIQFAPGLPKTRSGKIMRRILRKIASNELESLGDTSTLADPDVVDELIENRVNR